MSKTTFIQTARLVLRRWGPDDVQPFADINSDPEVMRWLGRGKMGLDEAESYIAQCEEHFQLHGFGLWAVERLSDRALIGLSGLRCVRGPDHPMAPCIEIAWRQASSAWGHGYATEAASAALHDGFQRVGLEHVLSWTAAANIRSQGVMRRIGMSRAEHLDFDHPTLSCEHPLSRHLVFSARRIVDVNQDPAV